MYIIGMIFKIIGILLLVLLGIVIVLLLSVLFVPIRYKFRWKKQPEKPHCVYATLSWWLRIIAVSVEYQEQFRYVIRVFGIPVKKGALRQEEETKNEEENWENVSDDFAFGEDCSNVFPEESKQETLKKGEETVKIPEGKRASETVENRQGKEEVFPRKEKKEQENVKGNVSKDVQKEMASTKKNRTSKKENTKKEHEKNVEIETDAQEFEIAVPKPLEKKVHIWERWIEKVKRSVFFLKNIPKYFKSMFYKVRDLWQNVDNKREHVLKQIHIVLDLWRAEENQRGKRLIFTKGKKIVRHIIPKKCKGYIRFGLADPAATGQALAVISIISGLVGVMPNIEPDFSKETLEGNFYCRGRLQIGYLLWQGLSLWFHEDMKKVKDNFEKVRRAF